MMVCNSFSLEISRSSILVDQISASVGVQSSHFQLFFG
jgi:hypothetical protein